MKRTLASMLLPFSIWAGCDSNEPPNTSGNCKGLMTINLDVPGGVNSAKSVASTVIGPQGVRYDQVDAPPLALPNVLLRLRELYQPGNQVVRVAAASSDPSKGTASAPAAVTSVARSNFNAQDVCPSTRLSLTATRTLDICLDRCDAEVRCAQKPFSALEACQDDCRQLEAEFAQQQADWTAQYMNATEIITKLEGCNFVACSAIESCGEKVMQSAIPKP